MAENKPETCCPRCAELGARVAALEALVAALEAKLAKAQKHSGNSSKPPSSDIVKPRRKAGKKGRRRKPKIGGQPGHDRHERTPFSPEKRDEHRLWHYTECPCCGGGLHDARELGRTIQQVELPQVPVQIEQHTARGQWCPKCQRTFIPTLPDELRKAGLVGPRLTALVGFLKGACHMSYSTLRKYFRDVLGVAISRGMLRNLAGKVSASLADPYEALCAMLPTEDRLNVDETGHKENGQRLWTWCFRAYLYTVYKISPSRGSEVLIEVLGKEFDGILGCDYFSAYHKHKSPNPRHPVSCQPAGISAIAWPALAGAANRPGPRTECLDSAIAQAHPTADGARPAGFKTRQANHIHTRDKVVVPKKYRKSVDHYTQYASLRTVRR
jgi:transposase